jgi:hypothetical protein
MEQEQEGIERERWYMLGEQFGYAGWVGERERERCRERDRS